MQIKFKKYFFTIIISLVIIQNAVLIAGEINKFEADVTKNTLPKFHSQINSHSHHGYGYSTAGYIFADVFYEVFFWALFTGGASSVERMIPKNPSLNVEPREIGDPLLPLLKVNSSYEWLQNEIYAVDLSFQCGWGPIAFRLRNTEYNEPHPDTKLEVLNTEFLYRISFSKNFEIDLGLGSLRLKGINSDSGASLSTPILFYPFKHLGFEAKPLWAEINNNSIRDYDMCIVLTVPFASIRTGYRIFKSENESLKGPYVGISLHF